MHDFSTLVHVRQRATHAMESAEHSAEVRRAREAAGQAGGWMHSRFFHRRDGS
jgi:hypothetical protein